MDKTYVTHPMRHYCIGEKKFLGDRLSETQMVERIKPVFYTLYRKEFPKFFVIVAR